MKRVQRRLNQGRAIKLCWKANKTSSPALINKASRPRTRGPNQYLAVLDALDHGPAIVLPGTSCRLGGFELGIDARLLPFTDFFAHGQSIGDYRACVEETVNQLSRQRLYDRRLGDIPSR
jgi:hypothetical protein